MRITQLLKSLSACLLLSVLCAQPALALQQTRDSHADSRIKYATYRSDEVFPVLTKEGFVTTISFEKDEEVTSYGSGYSSAWETATSENQFFLKPKTLDGETNFVIVTNKRVYSFEVRYAKKGESPTFRMIFRYPDTAAKLAKEKKEKEKRLPEPKVLTRRATIVLVAFCVTLIAAITFLSSFLPEYADKTEARRAFYAGDYKTVYEQLNNKKLGSSDEIMYQCATEILSLQHKLDSYHNRMALGEDMEALDALFQGVDLYIELAGSDTSGSQNELTAIYQQICTILQDDYGVSPEEAVEINGYDNETYTRKLDSILHGTEFYLPGEEPVEETPSVPEDVLPDEEAFIDMGDNV